MLIKVDEGKKVIYSNYLRKIIVDLVNETNYSEETEEELNIPKTTKFTFHKKRYLT